MDCLKSIHDFLFQQHRIESNPCTNVLTIIYKSSPDCESYIIATEDRYRKTIVAIIRYSVKDIYGACSMIMRCEAELLAKTVAPLYNQPCVRAIYINDALSWENEFLSDDKPAL